MKQCSGYTSFDEQNWNGNTCAGGLAAELSIFCTGSIKRTQHSVIVSQLYSRALVRMPLAAPSPNLSTDLCACGHGPIVRSFNLRSDLLTVCSIILHHHEVADAGYLLFLSLSLQILGNIVESMLTDHNDVHV